MTRGPRLATALRGLLITMALATPAAAQNSSAADGNDLRDVRVGMAVADLPSAGYAGFACAADETRKVAGWSAARDCPADASGLHALRYGYDKDTDREGVVVAGHPAVLTLLVDNDGKVGGLRIETDPKARLYLRKKAFLFGAQIKSRYGADGWTCTQAQPEAGEEPVGGVYIKERCTKSTQGRDITFERSLFRRAGSDARTFVDETRMTILRAKT